MVGFSPSSLVEASTPPFGGVAGYLYYVRLGSAVVRDDPAVGGIRFRGIASGNHPSGNCWVNFSSCTWEASQCNDIRTSWKLILQMVGFLLSFCKWLVFEERCGDSTLLGLFR